MAGYLGGHSLIIYQATKRDFLHHALHDDIEDVVTRRYKHATGHRVAPSEIKAWASSLMQMAKVLGDDGIPGEAGVAIEYQVPQTAKRIDFLITGLDADRQPKVIIVELKQWSDARVSDKDGIIWARRGGRVGETEGAHPSYQAWSYAALLSDFNAAVQDDSLELRPCAYLHNYPARDGIIDHPSYAAHLARAPLFVKTERTKLQAFIRQHVRHGDDQQLLYRIEHGRIRPSKMLSEAVTGLLQGKSEFVLVDDQKLVYESVLKVAALTREERKQVVIIQGGPGTGKSVVALNLLGAFLAKERNARYVSKNAAPRAVFEAKLTGTFRKSRISNLFSGSGAFTESEANAFDVLIVDEAHRLNEKSGLYGNLGENQIKELIHAARCTVFFVDDDQRVTMADIGDAEALRRWAKSMGAELTELALSSQFRCSGSDGYLAWLDDVLEIRATANTTLDDAGYDLRMLDSPSELHQLIEKRNALNNKARVVAGYCWAWPSKKDPKADDIVIGLPDGGAYQRQWNLDSDGSLWIMAPESVRQVGCIHTCQGLEVDYIGVIIGPDLVYRDGQVTVVPSARANSDKSIKGLKSLRKQDPQGATELADRIIKNTYRTLMTRGMKGCYVYCCDKPLADYLRSRIGMETKLNRDVQEHFAASASASASAPKPQTVRPFRLLQAVERMSGHPAIPVLDLKLAAGQFSESQMLDDSATEWMDAVGLKYKSDQCFVAQVLGESMNRVIPNGAWCVFRLNPAGSRNGKVVAVQHRSIDDPEWGGRLTVKRYHSVKSPGLPDAGNHRIVLSPDSSDPSFVPMVFDAGADDGEVQVIAELVQVLGNDIQ